MKRALPLLILCGCAGFPAPTPEVLEEVRKLPPLPGPYVRVRARMNSDSEWMSGQVEGVIVARTGAHPMLRAQCLPDIGGKVMDVLATPKRIVGWFPQQNRGADVALPNREIPNPLVVMGLSLLEVNAPVTPERVLGARRTPEGWLLHLEPAAKGVFLMALLVPGAGIKVRRFVSNHVQWELESEGLTTFVVRTPGMTMRAEATSVTALESLPDSLFQLELPQGVRPFEPPQR